MRVQNNRHVPQPGHKQKERTQARKELVHDLRAEYFKDGFISPKERNALNAARGDETGKKAAVALVAAREKAAEKTALAELKNTLTGDGVFSAADKALMQEARGAFKKDAQQLEVQVKKAVQKDGVAKAIAELPDPLAELRRTVDRVLKKRVVDVPPPPPAAQ